MHKFCLFSSSEDFTQLSFNPTQETMDFFPCTCAETGMIQPEKTRQAGKGVFPFGYIQIFLRTMPIVITYTNICTADPMAQNLQVAAAGSLGILKSQSLCDVLPETFRIIHLIEQSGAGSFPVQFQHKLMAI